MAESLPILHESLSPIFTKLYWELNNKYTGMILTESVYLSEDNLIECLKIKKASLDLSKGPLKCEM